MQGPDLFLDPDPQQSPPPSSGAAHPRARAEGIWAAGDRVAWLAGLILALSSFMDWYAGSSVGVTVSVIGWHTGILGKLVFFIGLAVVAIVVLRESGIDLPSSAPESLVILALGVLGTVFVLIRVITIPDAVLPADSRGIGIWIALLAGLGVIVGGLLRAAEDL